MKVISRKDHKLIGNLIVDGAYKYVSKFAIEDDKGNRIAEYDSIETLCRDFKDYEEPKWDWYIDWDGEIKQCDNRVDALLKFETKEEAEKAVEKLKAWKRLKDKGFRFTLTPGVGSLDVNPGKFQIEINADMPAKWFCCDAVQEDLDACFGGEE